MDFNGLRQAIVSYASIPFIEASQKMEEIIFGLKKTDIMTLLLQIGTIPEDIAHDSTEEKLYTKASDILFARALKELNYTVKVLRERADCADIIAQSRYHRYSLVGDAKAFRLSRTAKNAKDFKIASMDHWRGDSEYSVLACPYFHYPKTSSQIYKDALDKNVSLFAWEYLYILLKENVKETATTDLRDLWNQSAIISAEVTVGNAKANFLTKQNDNISQIIGLPAARFNEYFTSIKSSLIERGNTEINFYENEIDRIKSLSREEAIKELLISSKIESKINTIKQFIEQVQQ